MAHHFIARVLYTVALVLSFVSGSQGADTARDHFYSAASGGDAAPAWVGLRTSIMLKTTTGDTCDFRDVEEGFAFKPQDRFRIRIQPNRSGHLYLVARDGEGNFRLLYPYESAGEAGDMVERFQVVSAPGDSWFAFDDLPGVQNLYAFFSRKPMRQFERLVANPRKPIKDGELQKLVDKAGNDEELSMEESSLDGAVPATFFVSRVRWNSQFVARRLRLRNTGR